MLKRSSTAVWHGNGPQGTGTITTLSGALEDQPYGFNTRFAAEDGKAGTNPEELIAAAHASCFTMALAFALTTAGHVPTTLETKAVVSMEKQDPGWTITVIALEYRDRAVVARRSQRAGRRLEEGCPISRALAACRLTLTATLAYLSARAGGSACAPA